MSGALAAHDKHQLHPKKQRIYRARPSRRKRNCRRKNLRRFARLLHFIACRIQPPTTTSTRSTSPSLLTLRRRRSPPLLGTGIIHEVQCRHSASSFACGFIFQRSPPATGPHHHLQSEIWTNRLYPTLS